MPAHGKGLATIQHPWPVHTMIDFCREVLDFLVGKILPCSENAAQKNRGVDRGELAFGPAIAGFHVDEMKEETMLVVYVVGQEAQRVAKALGNLCGFPVTAMVANAKAGQAKSRGGYA